MSSGYFSWKRFLLQSLSPSCSSSIPSSSASGGRKRQREREAARKLKRGNSEVAAPLQIVRLKRNAAENLREKEAIRPKRPSGGERVGAEEK